MATGPIGSITCGGSAPVPGPTPAPVPPPPVPPPADIKAPLVTLRVVRQGKSSNYSITTEATDFVGVTRFEVKLNGRQIASVPGLITVSLKLRGQHTITAQGWDKAGNASLLATQTVTR